MKPTPTSRTKNMISNLSVDKTTFLPATRDLFATAIVLLITSSFVACAHLNGASPSVSKRSSDQVIKADAHTGDPLTSLEQELTKVHSDRVIVSTALLKSLVKNERLQQTQCKNISGQLEAIKNVDLEEAEGPKE